MGLRGRSVLARQLIVAFLVVTVPGTVALGAVALYELNVAGQVSDQLAEIIRSLEATRDLHLTLVQAEAPLDEYLLSGDPRSRQEFERLLTTAEAKLTSCASTRCHESSRTPAEMAALLQPAISGLRDTGRSIFETPTPAREPAVVARAQTAGRAVAGVHEQIERMSGTLLRRVEDLGAQSQALSRRASVLTASLAAGIALLACAAAVAIARRITHPLNELLAGIRRVMAGDWSSRVQVAPGGEIGELASSFNAMVDEVRRHRQRLEEYGRTLEERVRQRTEELKQKDQALLESEKLASIGLLAAGVAHELNNPLTSIVMNANLMIEEVGKNSPLGADLARIDADAGRCKRIIDDLRAFARRPDLHPTPSRVEAVVAQALQSAHHELEPRQIRVDCQVAPDLPEVVWDAQRMVQVLTNLIANAAHAIGHDGRLTIRGHRGDGWLTLEIRDTGAGIPAEDRSRIFDPFFTTKPDGTGLGLSISHGIVSAHGGRIEVESRTRDEAAPGEVGTAVRVILPLVPRPS